ncbi:uncharacterized protein LOC127844008 [Dreissena polymorpha]|uniref:Uncharacterized protein n=1 Tax=Dreissena polymorpha TaxID=45954 RepID=A0A9D4N3Z3_DREPO|nr:uncharacterized protein LOC127844008 [Dreissena polymorpha]KAH3887380.1 hypothetical protein DPMN_011396 [Dreissena polymorpha]
MATDSPSPPIRFDQNGNYGRLFEQERSENRPVFASAVPLRLGNDDVGNGLPTVPIIHTKRNSEGQVLQVKFASEVTIARISDNMAVSSGLVIVNQSLERQKPLVPNILNVDHNHYEQWARIKGRRVPNSSLLRGIQALKARMKRESIEQDRPETRSSANSRVLHINTLSKNSMLTRDKLTDEKWSLKREKSVFHLPKQPIELRGVLKTNAHVIDSESFKNDDSHDLEGCDSRQDRVPHREQIKPRIGVARIKDRCALPVSVYQPISIGDHVFFINEPIRYSEFIRMRSRQRKDGSMSSNENLRQSDDNLHNPNIEIGLEGLDRAKSFTLETQFIKNKRAPAVVPSAELFDFSQLSEIRSTMESKIAERSKTEFSFNVRGSRSVKLVPNVRRLKEGSMKT